MRVVLDIAAPELVAIRVLRLLLRRHPLDPAALVRAVGTAGSRPVRGTELSSVERVDRVELRVVDLKSGPHVQCVWRTGPRVDTRNVAVGDPAGWADLVDELLALLRTRIDWREIAEPGQLEEVSRHYVEFSFRLDTTLLPRPMQIGISGQPDWSLSVERTQRFN